MADDFDSPDVEAQVAADLTALKESYRNGEMEAEEFREQKKALVQERVNLRAQQEQSGERTPGTTVEGDAEGSN